MYFTDSLSLKSLSWILKLDQFDWNMKNWNWQEMFLPATCTMFVWTSKEDLFEVLKGFQSLNLTHRCEDHHNLFTPFQTFSYPPTYRRSQEKFIGNKSQDILLHFQLFSYEPAFLFLPGSEGKFSKKIHWIFGPRNKNEKLKEKEKEKRFFREDKWPRPKALQHNVHPNF